MGSSTSRRRLLSATALGGALASLTACTDGPARNDEGCPTPPPDTATGALGFALTDTAAEGPVPVDRTTIRAVVGNDHTLIRALPEGTAVDRDVMIPTRTGPRLAANVYRPATPGPNPVVMSCTTYGKDLHPLDYLLAGRGPTNRSIGLDMGDIAVSEATPFEAADPGYWTRHGYAVVHVDALGSGRSEGDAALGLGEAAVAAFADAVTWVAGQPWSNGRVGLVGVSYLAAVQWHIAALQPEGLAAIVPWEGFTDVYADVAVHGGIPETSFLPWWLAGSKDTAPGSDDPPTFHTRTPEVPEGPAGAIVALAAGATPTRESLPLHPPDVTRITVPALVCGSWSAQGLHSRGAFDGFRRIASTEKHLYTHGRHEWTVSHSLDALDHTRSFLDRHLAGRPDAPPIPPVRLEVRRTREEYEVRDVDAFPPAEAVPTRLHLLADGRLDLDAPAAPGAVTYRSTDPTDSATFTMRFDRDTEITGPAALVVWMSTSAGPDLDLFVGLRKLDRNGGEVPFWNMLHRNDIVTRGWLRASQRRLDPDVNDPLRPTPAYTGELPVPIGEPMELRVELLPSSTLFEQGSSLVLELKGSDISRTRLQQHLQLLNGGDHTVHLGDGRTSHLLVPVIPR